MTRDENKKTESGQQLTTTLLIVLIALASVAAATFAWFSIADTTRLSNMHMDITTGKSLRFDLTAHQSFDDYQKTLDFNEICKKVLAEQGVDWNSNVLEPVTTSDGVHFYYQDGTEAAFRDADYYEFTLHFMSTANMKVHLTSENGEDAADGTLISSQNADTPLAMRVSFQPDAEDDTADPDILTKVYDPGMTGIGMKQGKMLLFGLFSAENMEYNELNTLFSIKENTDVPVVVRIWVEGTDEACSNEIKNSDFQIRLRFEGTDENGQKYY